MNRRDLLKISAAATVALPARAQQAHRFFTPEEYAAVDELTEMIIPADAKSGGAHAAKVADYIDHRLAEAFEQEDRDRWRAGLKPFLGIASAARLARLTEMNDSKDPFFAVLKDATIRGYYTSSIGIHDDMDYKGNTYQQGDYSGELP
jgi:hypothetical protein